MPEISNKLAATRKRCGISAAALAGKIGVSRQTIYAVEAGTYVPNTMIGLRMAQALGVSMEDLFSLADDSKFNRHSERASVLPEGEELQPGQPVQLCKIKGRLIAAAPAPAAWYLPPSDASVSGNTSVRGTARVEVHEQNVDFENRILLAGCDPAMGMLARHLRSAGIELVLLHQNSSQSLQLLKRGFAHVAGSHLRDDSSDNSNVEMVNKLFPSKSVVLISFAIWQEGLITATGNPKHLKSVQDLARKDVTFVNREAGSGSRALLDRHLRKLRLDSNRLHGYLRTVPGHLAAAWEVKTGNVDCCLSTEASARFFGLNFIPLETVRYDLAVGKREIQKPGIQVLLDAINQLSFRRKLASISGYDTSVTGSRIQ